MQRDVYEKARRLAAADRVVLTAETPKAAYFEVAGDSGLHRVRLMQDHTFNCTCAWGSLKGAPRGALCSHVVAALLAYAAGALSSSPEEADAR